MKSAPGRNVPGDTPSEWLSNALRAVLIVSKADRLIIEEKWKRTQVKKKGTNPYGG